MVQLSIQSDTLNSLFNIEHKNVSVTLDESMGPNDSGEISLVNSTVLG